MYCIRCGAQIPDDARFCGQCGQDQTNAIISPTGQMPAGRLPAKTARRIRVGLLIAGGFAIVFLLGLAFLINSQSSIEVAVSPIEDSNNITTTNQESLGEISNTSTPSRIVQPIPSHTSPAANSVVTASQSSFPFRFVPFNFILQDAGDGWNQGEVQLAFENATDSVIPGIDFLQTFPNGIVVETLEGPTYPGVLATRGHPSNRNELRLSGLGPLPPGFRFYKIGKGDIAGYYSIQWKSAIAATPKRITFVDLPELSFELPIDKGTTVSFPFDNPSTPISSFSSLKDVDLVNDPGRVRATFTGVCNYIYFYYPNAMSYRMGLNGDLYFLEIQVTNGDNFNEATGLFSIPMSFFYSSGEAVYSNNAAIQPEPSASIYMEQQGNVRLGPGQSAINYMPVYGAASIDEKPPIAVFWKDTGFVVYDTSDCKHIEVK